MVSLVSKQKVHISVSDNLHFIKPRWFNPEIKINHQPVSYQRWTRVGIYCINDLLKDDGSFCTLQELQDKHKQNSHFLEYNGLIYVIPQKWKNESVSDNLHFINISLVYTNLKLILY
jgi:hypothetical protein